MSCPVHKADRVKTCTRCVTEAKRTIGYGVEDGRVDSSGYSKNDEVEFNGKTYNVNKSSELFELADKLEERDYDPY